MISTTISMGNHGKPLDPSGKPWEPPWVVAAPWQFFHLFLCRLRERAPRPVVREERGQEGGPYRRHHMVAPDRLALSPGGKGHLIPVILHGTDADIGGTGDEAPAA